MGVVADSLYEGPHEGVRRQVFVPKWGKEGAVFYAVARNEVRALDAALPIRSSPS